MNKQLLFLLLMMTNLISIFPIFASCELDKYSETKKLDLNSSTLKADTVIHGSPGAFEFDSTIGYRQKVLYYIPNSLNKDTENAPTIVFMHGGGGTTGGLPEGALSAAEMYLYDLIAIAESLKIVILAPVSPLNWGWNTMFVNKEAVMITNQVLKLDSNKTVLMGHSMGGMGIGRSAMYIVDHFSGIMPLSSGVKDTDLIEARLRTYLHTAFRRQVGKNDHFSDFVSSSKKENKLMKKLAKKHKWEKNYKLKVYKGDHSYNLDLVEEDLNDILNNYPRNLYQKKILPVFYQANTHLDIFQYTNLNLHNISRFYWLEVAKYYPLPESTLSRQILAEATVVGNKFIIKTEENSAVEKFRVYISNKMVDLSLPIVIEVNGVEKYNGIIHNDLEMENKIKNYMMDSSFTFNNCIDINV